MTAFARRERERGRGIRFRRAARTLRRFRSLAMRRGRVRCGRWFCIASGADRVARTICYAARLRSGVARESAMKAARSKRPAKVFAQARLHQSRRFNSAPLRARHSARKNPPKPRRKARRAISAATAPHPPHAQWPGGARIAVNVNLNVEAGGEHCLLEGDAASEDMLTDIGFPSYAGVRSPMVEFGLRIWAARRLLAPAAHLPALRYQGQHPRRRARPAAISRIDARVRRRRS